MTPTDKIKLVDDMIKESAEYTIRNYLDTVQEIEAVEASPGQSDKNLYSEASFTGEIKRRMISLNRQDFLKTYPNAY